MAKAILHALEKNPESSVISQTTLTILITALRNSVSILHKQDIQTAARSIGQYVTGIDGAKIRLGDDCAAIPQGEGSNQQGSDQQGYLLFAAEGIWPQFVLQDPWFAGWCAVMVNLSDIAAMGGEAIAIVDTLWSQTLEKSEPLWAGMQAAANAYGIPIVGGHTNCHSSYDGLAVAVLGKSQALITSFDAQPGDALIMVMNMEGDYYGDYTFWNAATKTDPAILRKQLKLLPTLANKKLCTAGKDISMGGLAGTLLMLCEASGCGAVLNLDRVPKPSDTSWTKWLTSFPSYGFLLSAPKKNITEIERLFVPHGLTCTVVGEVIPGADVWFQLNQQQQLFWNLTHSLTGFNGSHQTGSQQAGSQQAGSQQTGSQQAGSQQRGLSE
ncbi:MAG: sll0787 family AIR synthase-like protein [Phormidesmis sp.]